MSISISVVIGTFPSNSQAQDAAKDPRIEAIMIELEIFKDKVEYANNASPAPTASIILSLKTPIENGYIFFPFKPLQNTPLDPSLRIKFL